jgi:hypothetical protein
VLVSVSNLLGQPVGEMSVVAESAKRKEDGVIVISKQKLISKSSDSYVSCAKLRRSIDIFFNLVRFMN